MNDIHMRSIHQLCAHVRSAHLITPDVDDPTRRVGEAAKLREPLHVVIESDGEGRGEPLRVIGAARVAQECAMADEPE